jgi:hypothetical protein
MFTMIALFCLANVAQTGMLGIFGGALWLFAVIGVVQDGLFIHYLDKKRRGK